MLHFLFSAESFTDFVVEVIQVYDIKESSDVSNKICIILLVYGLQITARKHHIV